MLYADWAMRAAWRIERATLFAEPESLIPAFAAIIREEQEMNLAFHFGSRGTSYGGPSLGLTMVDFSGSGGAGGCVEPRAIAAEEEG